MGWVVWGSNPSGGKNIRTHPDRSWGPPSPLYNGYQVFPGDKAAGHGVDHPPPSSADVKEIVELYHYSPLGLCGLFYLYLYLYCDNQTHHYLLYCPLTFKNLASYIWDRHTATLQMFHFIYIFSPTISTEYFKHAAQAPFFSSKCRLFHNATFFGSCVIHILYTGCAKI
jgi:hypothetical protein